MPRIHAPELEDEPWFPVQIRDGITDFLQVAAERLRLFAPVVPLIRDLLAETNARRIIDLCSGGGGPVVSLVDALERKHGVRVPAVLTDKYPNAEAFDRAVARGNGKVTAIRESVDVRSVPAELDGLRTLFNAFHHFRPEVGREVLEDAARKRQPIAIFELVDRRVTTMATMAFTPLAVLSMTPLIRPLRLRRLFWTYAVPAVPGAVLWDGLASCLRAYSPAELDTLARACDRIGYTWTSGQIPIPYSLGRITYLVGKPIGIGARA